MNLPGGIPVLLEKITRIIRHCLVALGVVLTVSVIFSFTDYPFWAYYWLGTHNSELEPDPELIVLMGGGGMPSPDGLIRCYYAANVANHYPDIDVIIAVPADTALEEDSPDQLMRHELIIRGVDSMRISFESEGMNTRTQAINIKNLLTDSAKASTPIRLVTTPEHMLRSVAAFRKVGFEHVGGMPSFGKDLNAEMLVKKKKKKGTGQEKQMQALGLRYNMWNYMKYEITVLRELCAIGYYKLRGWM